MSPKASNVNTKKAEPKISLVEETDARFSSYMDVDKDRRVENDDEVIYVEESFKEEHSEGNGIVNSHATKVQRKKSKTKVVI